MSFYRHFKVKGLFLLLAYWTGTLWLWRFLHRHQITILTVHGVMDTGESTSWVPLRPQLSRRTLEDNVRHLSQYYHFVSMQSAVAMLSGNAPVRPYCLVLTFDDGYRNNLKHALPILRRYHVPATFFVAPSHIEQRKPFWFDRLDYALQSVDLNGRTIEIGRTAIRFHSKDRRVLGDSYRVLREAAKAIPHDLEMQQELEAFVETLERESGRRLADIWEDDDWSVVLNWTEIQTAISQSVTIGSHTMDHVRLGLVDLNVAQHQLLRSKQRIEEQTGQPCRYFCYPNGSVTAEVAALVRTCGYEAAVTTEEGGNTVGVDLMTLRRIALPSSTSPIETLATVSGLSAALSRMKVGLQTLLRRYCDWRSSVAGEKDSAVLSKG